MFGKRVDELTTSDLEPLLARPAGDRIREDVDLEFKSTLYSRDEKGKSELAKDVAAMANDRGGVILIGIGEDPPGEAASLSPVAFTDEEERRIRQVVASSVAPLPDLSLIRIGTRDDPGRGVYGILVPASPLAPHGVKQNDAWRYPARDGAYTRSLAESEIAERYRRRFRQSERQVDRLTQVVDEGARAATPPEDFRVWLALALVPSVAGRMTIDSRGLEAFRRWGAKFDGHLGDGPVGSGGFSLENVTTGVGCVVADSGRSKEGLPHIFLGQFYDDGSGFTGRDMMTEHRARASELSGGVSPLVDEEIVSATVGMARMLVDHATANCGARGDALAVVTLLARTPGDMIMGHTRHFDSWHEWTSSKKLGTIRTLRPRGLNLDAIETDPRERLVSARLLLTDLFHGFGIAEVPQITADGQLRTRYWNARRLESWRSMAAVPRTDETFR
jgi:hypothetical protein